MKSLQLPVQTDLAITGAKAYLNKEKAGNASLALIGELDALGIPQHAHANQETQAAHCCGHHAQLAGVIGAALALTDAEVAQKLDGQVIFFATPAEEYGEIEFKNQLIADTPFSGHPAAWAAFPLIRITLDTKPLPLLLPSRIPSKEI